MELMILGYFFDLCFGDPYWIPHPIVFIGNSIKRFELFLRKYFNGSRKEKLGGILLALGIISITFIITFLIIKFLYGINSTLGRVIEAFLIFQILATKSLGRESKKVYYPLRNKDLKEARKFLSYIVGRDTSNLDEKQITKATVETIAENISDGIIAPLFYIFIGGAPLGMLYKAINTLDSMVGYKNDKYINFGWASAKIDDLANYIPARITAILIVLASFILKLNYKNSFKILIRDKRNHTSPNAGYPESAVAGALGIQLGGTNIYFGKKVEKPTLGDNLREVEIDDINKTIGIMYGSSFLGICLFAVLGYLI